MMMIIDMWITFFRDNYQFKKLMQKTLLSKYMAAGENGVNGKLVLQVVGEETKNELDYVTTQYHNLKGKYVHWMDL